MPMDIVEIVEHDVKELESSWQALRLRATNALNNIAMRFGVSHHAEIVALLTKAHEQAERAILNGEEAVQDEVPWELAHGLSILGLLDGAKPLPQTPEEFPTHVMKNGRLLGCRRWELLDPNWSEAIVKWLEYIDHHADFGTTPTLITMPNDVVLAIAGDWGTGTTEADAPARSVANAMSDVRADYTVHLGDVYYAGTDTDEQNHMSSWPQGRLGSFALNSNHEMYSGAFGYFSELQRNFPKQQGTSYFALQNDAWLVIGLDSAYNADRFKLYMEGQLDQSQLDWIASLLKGKRVIVLSHHEGIDAATNEKTALYQQVRNALGRDPDYWYWGHEHNGVCYRPLGEFHGRCVGHGALPCGVASELVDNANVAWYETKIAQDSNYPERVLNGFVKITLHGDMITERFIGEDASVRWTIP
jgi:predicted phosphodiesterase